jgi:hypothetical protein
MNNPPAFPSPYALPEHYGMTLRDYFAAKAMQGLLAGTTTSDGNMIVKDAYAIADAMLKAREA